MSIEVKVPELPESVADGLLLEWHIKAGDQVMRDDNLVDIETDKVVLEIPSPDSGVIVELHKKNGDVVTSGEVLAVLDADVTMMAPHNPDTASKSDSLAATGSAPAAMSPAVKQLIADHSLNPDEITGTGKDGRVIKQDVLAFIADKEKAKSTSIRAETMTMPSMPVIEKVAERREERVPMTRLRARVAERLLKSQQSAAILTTFNEVNMQQVMDMRAKYRDNFERKHDVKLGFMSFFVRACAEALKQYPIINASVDGDDIVYHGYYDIGIAVSSPRGLVVPILRDVEGLSFADIEKMIRDFGARARDGKLGFQDLSGGTFSITNGGIFGSMLSTPIINPPQSAILGMHNITDRAVVEDGKVVVRPVMYLALSYDHRIIDGRDAVQFLSSIKHSLEDPASMLLDI